MIYTTYRLIETHTFKQLVENLPTVELIVKTPTSEATIYISKNTKDYIVRYSNNHYVIPIKELEEDEYCFISKDENYLLSYNHENYLVLGVATKKTETEDE